MAEMETAVVNIYLRRKYYLKLALEVAQNDFIIVIVAVDIKI
jgi:hypothetical protein